jgi:gliding motility-associated protein GldL
MGITELVESRAYKKFMGKVYGWGASVVLVGALFKIQHYPGASTMLVIGLGTEATIFFLSAFEPIHEEIDWTLVYPELAGMGKMEEEMGTIPEQNKKSALEQFNEMIEKAQITPELFEKLGNGLQKLNQTTEKLHDVTDATQATNNYVSNFEKASEKVLEFSDFYSKKAQGVGQSAEALSDAYLKSVDTLNETSKEFAQVVNKSGNDLASGINKAQANTSEVLSNAANDFAKTVSESGKGFAKNISNAHVKSTETLNLAADELADIISKTGTEVHTMVSKSGQNLANAYEKLSLSMNEEIGKSSTGNKSYGEQLEMMTKNLTALNAVYELQLQGTNEHLEISKKLFKGMDEMMVDLEGAIVDSKKYRTEVSKLGQNLSALNTIYGNMLSAMNFKGANS